MKTHWFPLIRPYEAEISERGTLGGGRLISYDNGKGKSLTLKNCRLQCGYELRGRTALSTLLVSICLI